MIGKLLLLVSNQSSEETAVLFDRIAHQVPDALLRRITERLDEFAEPEQSAPGDRHGSGNGGFSTDPPAKTFEIANPAITLWKKALPFYAENVEPTAASLRRLLQIRDRMKAEKIHRNFNRDFGERTFTEAEVDQRIDDAIKNLAARYVESHGELPAALRRRVADASDTDSQSENTPTPSKENATLPTENAEPQASDSKTCPASELTYQGQSFEHWPGMPGCTPRQ